MAAYTTIDDPSAHFQTKVYTGSNSNQSITNDGNSDLQPDWIFASYRTLPPYTNHRAIIDSSRGRAKILESDTSAAEVSTTNAAYDLVSFDTNGFTVGAVNSTSALNASGISHVAWQWKANGGTTATNNDGSTASTVQVNQDAGFSIITYTGTGSETTFGHGLGVAPEVIIAKKRGGSASWVVWFKAFNNSDGYLVLNATDKMEEATTIFTNTDPTSSVITLGSSSTVNQNTVTHLMYAFSPKQGYSKFGKYVGNGNANGTFVYTGFKPAFVMIKPTSYTEAWVIIDAERNPYNQAMLQLNPNSSGAEYNGASVTNGIDILSNGFKVRTSRTELNTSGGSLIYMAFAENPFVTSTGVPTTAR